MGIVFMSGDEFFFDAIEEEIDSMYIEDCNGVRHVFRDGIYMGWYRP